MDKAYFPTADHVGAERLTAAPFAGRGLATEHDRRSSDRPAWKKVMHELKQPIKYLYMFT